MHSNVVQMKRIFDNPAHRHYGPARRAWLMLEQLFADYGGLARFELRLANYQASEGIQRPHWDDHLSFLMSQGLSEAPAQRLVLTQMLTAQQWIGSC